MCAYSHIHGPLGDPITLDWVKWRHPELTEEEAISFLAYLNGKWISMYTDSYYRPHGHALYVEFFKRPIPDDL